MVDNARKCAACGDGMVFFPSEGGFALEGKGIHQCIRADCELQGMSQPEHDGHSIAGFGSDGTVTLIQQGRTSQSEENLPTILARISRCLPERYTIKLAVGFEVGVDIIVRCKICGAKREIQVTRAVDPGFARATCNSNVTWTTSEPAEVIKRLGAILDKKTKKHPGRGDQVLVIDTAVDEMWTPILGGLEEMRSLLSGSGWYSVMLIGPLGVVRVDGEDLEQWCVCHGSVRTS